MYQRQELYLGKGKQDRLFNTKVVLIGCGALGSNIGIGLARAGIGHIVLVDRDMVEEENLGTHQYSRRDIGMPKSAALKDKIADINHQIEVEAIVADVNRTNVEGIVKKGQLVLDGTDNMEARFLVNDACVKHDMPWIYGSCVRSSGSVSVFHPHGPCLRCVFPKVPTKRETADTVGILSTLPPMIAGMELSEAVKILTGDKPSQDMVFYDADKQSFDKIELKKNKSCKACSKHHYKFLKSKAKKTTVLLGKNTVQVVPSRSLNIEELMKRLQKSEVEILGGNLYLMNFKIRDYTITVFEDGRALVKGTSDEKIAKELYLKYVGA